MCPYSIGWLQMEEEEIANHFLPKKFIVMQEESLFKLFLKAFFIVVA